MRVQGFSLIELMIVIGVIALINIVMVPNFTALHRSAKQISAKSSARSFMVSLEQYYFIHQRYPEGADVPISMLFPTLKELALIQSDPINPFTGQAYSLDDASGKIVYSLTASDEYMLTGYGVDNQAVIFQYP